MDKRLNWPIAAVAILTLTAYVIFWSRILGFQWDVAVYARAVADYARGADPYRTDVYLPFVYHPFTLRVLVLLNHLAPVKVLFPALTLAAVGWLFVEFGQITVRAGDRGGAADAPPSAVSPKVLAFALLVAAGFGGVGAPALMSGNMSGLMHFTLLAAFLRAGRVDNVPSRYLPYALILAFALVKPYMLIYLAVPVLQEQKRVPALIAGVVVVALFAVCWFSFQAVWPDQYARFVTNLQWQTLSRGDVGYTFFYVFGHFTRQLATALELHGIVSLLLIALVPLLFTRKYGPDAPFAPKLAVIYLVLTLANPRMKDYDLFPALAAFFAVFALLFPRRAAPITLAGALVAAVPVFARLGAPRLFARHPLFFDPFGNWQILGLALIAVLFLVGMMDGEPLESETRARELKPL